MFNNENDSEGDFCESYKSQVLGSKENEEGRSFFSTIIKLLTILILLVIITGVSFYGYNYFLNNQNLRNSVLPPVSMQVSDDETVLDDSLVVEAEDLQIEETIEEENIPLPLIVSPQAEELKIEKTIEEDIPLPLLVSPQFEDEIEKIANDVKIAIAQSETKEENETRVKEKIVEEIKSTEALNDMNKEESLEVPTSVPEAKYLEQLAELSKEIDKERKK